MIRKYYKFKIFIFTSISIFVFCVNSFGQAEASINLDSCLSMVKQNYPLSKEKGYLEEIGKNNIKRINSEQLPQINLLSHATLQTEATTFDLGPEVLAYPKDNYSFGVHVTQTLFDFGLTSELKKVEQAETNTEVSKNEIELYKLNDKVLQLYGNILVSKENINILESYLDDIKNRRAKILSLVNNGAMLQSDLDVLDVEMLKTSQKLIEVSANQKVLYETLSLLINKEVDGNTLFAAIQTSNAQVPTISALRPEFQYFEKQKILIDETAKLINRKNLPRFSAFGEGIYGTTGYDLMKVDMHLYGIVGLKLSWNLSAIHSNRYEKRNLKIKKRRVDEQKELFELKMKTALVQSNGESSKLRDMIKLDSTIVNKRVSVSKIAANQLENGAITSVDYLTYLNEEKQAVLSQRIHEIQLGIALKHHDITSGIHIN